MASDTVAQTYTITDLGTLGGPFSYAYSLNERGEVAGRAATRQVSSRGIRVWHAFLWSPRTPNDTRGHLQDLGRLYDDPGALTLGNSVNESSHVVGDLAYWTDGPDVYGSLVWRDSAVIKLGFYATAINDLDHVVGTQIPFGSQNTVLLWREGVIADLGAPPGQSWASATAINALGQVVGYSEGGAFLWTPSTPNGTNGVFVPLHDVDGSCCGAASAINDSGQVVGRDASKLFVWTPSTPNGTNGTVTILAPLGPEEDGVASSINALAQVVGVIQSRPFGSPRRPFLWDKGVLTYLNDTLPATTNWFLTEAGAINDKGQIAGTAWVNGEYHAVLLTPVVFAPQLTAALALPGGRFRFTLLGEAERSYTIQASTNLMNWTALTNFVSATGTNQFTDPAAPNLSRRFYRALTQ